jgi:hypothetical protein
MALSDVLRHMPSAEPSRIAYHVTYLDKYNFVWILLFWFWHLEIFFGEDIMFRLNMCNRLPD